MTTNATTRRLRRAVDTYARDTWGVEVGKISRDQFTTMEIRADGYSNAHVEGEHEANGLCSFSGNMAARDCGEAGAAAEFVETYTVDDEPAARKAPTNRGDRAAMTHRGHDHPNTKADRAKCRRAVYSLRNELKGN